MNKQTKHVIILISFLIICVAIILFLLNYIYKNLIYEKEQIANIGWVPVSEVDISEVSEDVIGYLSIPKFNNDYYLNMPIKETVELDVLATSIGHFAQTPYDNGNICLAAHNSGTNMRGNYVGFFNKIKELSIGDLICYDNLSDIYKYEVISNTIIKETNLSVLDDSEENIITLITCITGVENRAYRQCVVAKRVV